MQGMDALLSWPVRHGGTVAMGSFAVALVAGWVWALLRPRQLAAKAARTARAEIGEVTGDLAGRDGDRVVVRGVLGAEADAPLEAGTVLGATMREEVIARPERIWIEQAKERVLLEGSFDVKAGGEEDWTDRLAVRRRVSVGDEVVVGGVLGERAASTRDGDYRGRAVRYVVTPEDGLLEVAVAAAPQVLTPSRGTLARGGIQAALLWLVLAWGLGWVSERSCRHGDDPQATACTVALMTPIHRKDALSAVDNNYLFTVDKRDDEAFTLEAMALHVHLGEPCQEVVDRVDRTHLDLFEAAATRCESVPSMRETARLRLRRGELEAAERLVDAAPVGAVGGATLLDLQLDMAVRMARKDYRAAGTLLHLAPKVTALTAAATDKEREQRQRHVDALHCLGLGFRAIGGELEAAVTKLRAERASSDAGDVCGLILASVLAGAERVAAVDAMPKDSYFGYRMLADALAETEDPARARAPSSELRGFTGVVAGSTIHMRDPTWRIAYAAALDERAEARARAVAALDAAEVWALVGERDEAFTMLDRADAALAELTTPTEPEEGAEPEEDAEPEVSDHELNERIEVRFNASRLRAAVLMRFGDLKAAEKALKPQFEVDEYRTPRGQELEGLLTYMQTGAVEELKATPADHYPVYGRHQGDDLLLEELSALAEDRGKALEEEMAHTLVPTLMAGGHHLKTSKAALREAIREVGPCEMSYTCSAFERAASAASLAHIAEHLGDEELAATMEARRKTHVEVLRRPELAILLVLFEELLR